ncbi:hypothetical protein ILUMI_14145 [Ignelater luminosus]|uniref:Serine protease K12H4.7 n=1 Tax=Ignelater luminosus TaxID=2038154 RepID=A0A8K0CQZ7_IGNLU|nr:hypothetical protein ILUMI_14145 [Ignelater luminosus]
MRYYLFMLLVLVQGLYGWRIHRHGKHLEFLIKSGRNNVDLAEQWFTQILDHTNSDDGRTWQQRFYVNDEFHSNNGPAFLFIGGEGEMSPYWATNGAWVQHARKFKALCFVVEHRFYGKSQPTGDLTTESLQYLSSEQALHDLKYFINEMSVKYGLDHNAKWVAFGGSYSGALAAWLRLKFPDLVHGAVASSAPILAKVDFSDDKFHLCEPIENSVNNSKHISTLYLSIASKFAETVQYNDQLQTQITNVCNTMNNEKNGEPIDRLAAVVSSDDCLYYNYSGIVDSLMDTKVIPENMFRQWTYQTCTEFGFYATSSAHPSVFGHGFPVEYFIEMCSDTFGQQFNADYINSQVKDTNRRYGGLKINVTNVVFVHGSIDPWHALGLTQTRNPEVPVIFIKGTSHCADMADDNSPKMQAVRERISGYIGQWLSEVLKQ